MGDVSKDAAFLALAVSGVAAFVPGGALAPPFSEGRKIALKLLKNVSNFKKILPAVPVGTAGSLFFHYEGQNF